MGFNGKVGEPDHRLFGRRVVAFLNELYPHKAAQNVEADTGGKIPAETISKWLAGISSPSGPYYQYLINTYGAELVYYVDPEASHASLRDAARRQRQERLERQVASMREEIDALARDHIDAARGRR